MVEEEIELETEETERLRGTKILCSLSIHVCVLEVCFTFSGGPPNLGKRN